MWEKDKKLVKKYRDCMNQLLADLRAGEEVDFESACIVESEKLQGYTFAQVNQWENNHPSQMSEKKQTYFTPKLPYFQQF